VAAEAAAATTPDAGAEPAAAEPEAGAGTSASAEASADAEPAAAESMKSDPATASAALSPELKQQMIESFRARSAQQMFDGDPDAAMATLATARRRMGYGNADLRNMELAFARAGEEFDRIRTAVSLNVTAHRQYLDEIRQASGDDLYPQVEQMLAGTLANQIADLRARGDRDSIATALLVSGHQLFPYHAALLEHGTAGVLGTAPVAVDPEREDKR
jgi:hypothetical protein